jgi:hypothetical protein
MYEFLRGNMQDVILNERSHGVIILSYFVVIQRRSMEIKEKPVCGRAKKSESSFS